MTSSCEIYRDWCELVMDAYNEHGGDVLDKFPPNTPTGNAADVIKELISQKKVLSLPRYLKTRRDDLFKSEPVQPRCNKCTGQPNLVEGINKHDGSTYLYCPVCKPAG